jgi:hypothetical protein
MTAGEARGGGGAVTERAVESGPGGERRRALGRMMLVMKEEVGHAIRVPDLAAPIIRVPP